jgi:hypothetical protein
LQGLYSNQKPLRPGNVDYLLPLHIWILYTAPALFQPMAKGGRHPGPIGSTNNRNRVRINRASIEGAGFNFPRRAAPH